MPWNSKPQNPDFGLQCSMTVFLHPFDKTVSSFIINVGKKHIILRILEHFIHDLDNPEYVTVIFPPKREEDPENKVYGGRPREIPLFVKLSVHKDDIPNIDENKPIRIICETDAFPEKKEAFIDFFEELRSIMRW